MSEELKTCPFCGANFLISQEPHDNGYIGGMFYIYHDYGPLGSPARKCIIEVPKHFGTREEAIESWNRRLDEVASPAVSSGLEFFPTNVDSWGALEWFDRLVHAVREHDRAGLSGDDARFELSRMTATSTAMTLAREYASDIRLALSSQSRLSEAVKVLEEAKTWHEEQDKALSKQPQTHGPSGNQWARLQHREQIDILQSFLATLGEEK